MSSTESSALELPEQGQNVQLVRRLLLNGAAMFGSYVLPRALTFASALVAARLLGPSQFGVYGAAAAYAMILSALISLGMLPLLTRELSRDSENAPALLGTAHALKAIAALVMLAGSLLIGRLLMGFDAVTMQAALILGLGYICAGFGENLNAWFQARERMHVWLQANFLFGLIGGAAGIVLVARTHSVLWFCLAFALGQLASLLWLARALPDGLRQPPRASWAQCARLFRIVLPFALGFGALTVFYKLDALVLRQLATSATVGIFAAGYKFVDVVQALAVVACAAIFPRLARVSGAAGRSAAGQRALEIFLLAVTPAAALFWLVREPLVVALFGEPYRASVTVTAFLAPALLPIVLNTLGWYLLSASDRLHRLAIAYTCAIALKVALASLLIPRFGAAGSAAAMMMTETLLCLGLLIALRHAGAGSLGTRSLVLAALVLLAAAALGALGVWPWLAAAGLAAITALVYVRGQALTPVEASALRQAVRP